MFTFDEIIITFIDQNGRHAEIEGKVNLELLIDKQKRQDILQNQEQKNMPIESKSVTDENSRNVEEVIIPPEKRKDILNELR